MKRIVVASHNPVKIQAVLNGFQRLFPQEIFVAQPVDVPSDVPDQPMSDQDALLGAQNRAVNAQAALPEAEFWVGVEGGCDYLGVDLVAFAWIVIITEGMTGSARTALFRLPQRVQELVESGVELGDADDQVFGATNSKQNSGAVGLLTEDVVTRTGLYEQAVILALIPFKNSELYRS
jgi:inosine/xanthosine triphosphatase